MPATLTPLAGSGPWPITTSSVSSSFPLLAQHPRLDHDIAKILPTNSASHVQCPPRLRLALPATALLVVVLWRVATYTIATILNHNPGAQPTRTERRRPA